MASSEDVARLLVQAEESGFAEQQAKIDLTRKKLADLHAAYHAGSVEILDYIDKGTALEKSLARQEAALDRARGAAAKLRAAHDAAGEAAARGGKGLGNLTTIVQQGGYALGDMAQASGDLGQKLNAITNNVQFALAPLGMWGVAVGTAATLGVSLYRNLDAIGRWFEEKTPFPKAAADVESMTRQVSAAKDRMAELEKNTNLTAGELAEYNKLRADVAATEAKITAEKEKQAAIDKLGKLKAPEVEAREKAQSEALQRSLGGDQADMGRRLAGALAAGDEARRSALGSQQAALVRRANTEGGEAQRRTLAEIARIEAEIRKIPTAESRRPEADRMLAEAVVNGNLRAFREIQTLVMGQPGKFTEAQRDAIRGASPEARDAWDALTEWAAGFLEKVEADEKLTKELNEQGLENQRAGAEAKSKQDKEDREKATKEDVARMTKAAAAAGRRQDERQKTIEGTDLDEMAAVEAARMRAGGGALDASGRFHKLSPEQQEARLRQMVSQALGRAMPDLNRLQRGNLADRIASKATRQADDLAEQARIDLAQQGVRGQELAAGGMQAALNATVALLNRARGLDAHMADMTKRFNDLAREVGVQTLTAQPTNR